MVAFPQRLVCDGLDRGAERGGARLELRQVREEARRLACAVEAGEAAREGGPLRQPVSKRIRHMSTILLTRKPRTTQTSLFPTKKLNKHFHL